MAQTKKEIRKEYDRRTYKQYNFRVRRDDELNKCLEAVIAAGGSVSALIKDLLEQHWWEPIERPKKKETDA